jgi:ribosomal protein S21
MTEKANIRPGSDSYLDKFKPLQVEVRSDSRDDFEYAAKTFKALVQREKVISNFKESQRYEKPSDKRRRKRREAAEKRFAMAAKQRLINSGEWEKRQKKKVNKQKNKEE